MATETIRAGKNGNKTLAVVTATLIVRHKFDAGSSDTGDVCTWLEGQVDATAILRRLSPAETRGAEKNNGTIEVRCDVEYGPVLGGYEADIARKLRAIAANEEAVLEAMVFNVDRCELTKSDVDGLTAKINDVTLPLHEWKRYEHVLRRLDRWTLRHARIAQRIVRKFDAAR